MNILLHTCCAACTLGAYGTLVEEGHTVRGFFCNPNIHPLIEFRRRLKAQKLLQEHLPIEMTYAEDYGLRQFLDEVDWQGAARCGDCYRMRLRRAALEAVRQGMDAFTTTLLVSVHQKHALLRQVGQECSEETGVPFYYQDWRGLSEKGHEEARRRHLYLQQYCGCVFSECERFENTALHLYRGSGPAACRE